MDRFRAVPDVFLPEQNEWRDPEPKPAPSVAAPRRRGVPPSGGASPVPRLCEYPYLDRVSFRRLAADKGGAAAASAARRAGSGGGQGPGGWRQAGRRFDT